jgi:hypothetical protein
MKIKNFFEDIFLISFLLFVIKWYFFLSNKLDLDLITKFIFEIEDWQYFTLIFNLSDLNFNPSYNPDLLNLKFLPFPIYSILYHSLFFNLFDIYGFIIVELIIIVLFFYIFFNFFKKLGINRIESIFLALLFFTLSDIIDFFQLSQIQYVGAIKELYNLRIPRPSISHLYLYFFFLLLISNNKNTNFKTLDLALIGSVFALMWGSFYYNLIISASIFLIYYLYIINNSIQRISKYFKDFLLVLIFFLLLSIPLIIILVNAEPDYLTRVGLVDLNLIKKKILLDHFATKLFSIKFVTIFIVITILYLFLTNKSFYKKEGINLLYFIFIGSFVGPLIFIIISPTISEPYHFMNILIALTFFVISVYLFLVLSLIVKNFVWNKLLTKILILSLLIFHLVNNYSLTRNDNFNVEKMNSNQLMHLIKKKKITKNSSILTFDTKIQTNLILNNYKNLIFVGGTGTPLTDDELENKIISIFNFLHLDKIDFYNFIKNKKHRWRFINNNIGKTFYMKYQANKLQTFNNSKNFLLEESKYISKSSPLNSQQLIIPIFEIERLLSKFDNFSKYEIISPELIILNLDDTITKKIVLDNNLYCSDTINDTFKIYFLKNNKLDC